MSPFFLFYEISQIQTCEGFLQTAKANKIELVHSPYPYNYNANFHDLLKMKILKIITDDLCKCNNEFDTPQITLRTEYDLLTKKKFSQAGC